MNPGPGIPGKIEKLVFFLNKEVKCKKDRNLKTRVE